MQEYSRVGGNAQEKKKADFRQLIGPVARRLLGEPNAKLSSKKELRWGTKGSLSVDLEKATWYDHENKQGGGLLKLIRREVGGNPWEWLRAEGFVRDNTVIAEFDYCDEQNVLLFQICRTVAKSFFARRPNGAGGWIMGIKGVRRVLYRLPELIASTDLVLIPEGEKHTDALRELGFCATCNSGGAGKWRAEFNGFLRGRDVVILPDNDEAGAKHAADIASNLTGIAKRVRMLELPGLPAKGDIIDWLEGGGTREVLLRLVGETQSEKTEESKKAYPRALITEKHGDAPPEPQKWAVRNRLPETGAGLLLGQWGMYKTFLVIDLSGHLILGWDWCGEPVYRQCGVLAFAPEGGKSLSSRFDAHIKYKLQPRMADPTGLFDPDYPPQVLDPARLPFEWSRTCPVLLTDRDALSIMTDTALAAHERFMRGFNLPLGLIWIDTMATAAGWKDEKDNPDATRVMDLLRKLSGSTSAVALGVDHFGKDIEQGARGASAKEANADFLLAALGERELSGSVSNGRLALRKLREGPQGLELPFRPRVVDMGEDDRGNPTTSVVIEWEQKPSAYSRTKGFDTTSLKLFRASLVNALVQHGRELMVPDTGEVVCAVEQDKVRNDFFCRYSTDNPESGSRTFRRMLHDAIAGNLIGRCEAEGVGFVWFLRSEDMDEVRRRSVASFAEGIGKGGENGD